MTAEHSWMNPRVGCRQCDALFPPVFASAATLLAGSRMLPFPALLLLCVGLLYGGTHLFVLSTYSWAHVVTSSRLPPAILLTLEVWCMLTYARVLAPSLPGHLLGGVVFVVSWCISLAT